ncbi:MAG: IS1634 family transposase [bacterium]
MKNEHSLESLCVGGHPVITPFMERLRLKEFFDVALGPPDRRCRLAPSESALVLVRNFTLSRHPLYGVPEWAARFDPGQFDMDERQLKFLNDDRLGRALDRMFTADLRSLMTRVIVNMVKEFDIDLERCHNDSTSITFSGVYRQKPARADGKRRLLVTHGHNKDHRPDLKQLVWSLSVTSDGAVPVHYNVYDGNVTDDTTHIETWDVLRRIAGSPDFIYVADSKLCTRDNMGHIAGHGGRFITLLPRTRGEDTRFRKHIAAKEVEWQTIWRRPSLRRKGDPREVFEAVAAPETTSEGYRLTWYRSSEKWKRDEATRDNAIQEARQEITRLRERCGRGKLKTSDQVSEAADKIIKETQTGQWLRVEIKPCQTSSFKQANPGRPGEKTRYVRRTAVKYEPFAALNENAIRASAAADGIFPLVTNIPADDASPLDILKYYKYQSFIEKRHEQLKTLAAVVPVNYKSPERIEAFLFLYFISVTIHALIERQTRNAMRERKIRSIPIYPEERECRAPTADKILGLFESFRRHRLFIGGKVTETFWDSLSDIQITILELLDIPTSEYGH